MALSDSAIGLLFRISSDSSVAQADVRALTEVFKGNFSSIEGILTRHIEKMLDTGKATNDTAQAERAAAQSFNILEGALVNFTGDVSKARSLTGEFTLALKQAAAGNEELEKVFGKLGVNISQALESPKQGLAQFLGGFSQLGTEAEKAAVAEAVFLTTTDGIVPALTAASAGMAGFATAEDAAAASAGLLDTALLPVIAVVAALVIAVGGIALAAGGLFSLAKGAGEAGKEVKDLSDKSGITVRNISLLRVAAQETGNDFSVVERSLDQFTSRLEKAASSSGNTELSRTFKALGVDAKEGIKDANAALDTAIVSLNKIENPTIRAARAQEIFGLRNEAIVPILTRISTGLDDYSRKLEGVGTLTEAQANQGKSFELSLNQLKATVVGLALNIGSDFIPLFQPLIDLTKTVVQLFGQGLITVLNLAGPSIAGVGTSIDVLNAGLRAAPLFLNVLRAALGEALVLFARTATVVGDTAKALTAFAVGNFAVAAESAGKVASGISGLFDGVGERTKKALEEAKIATAQNFQEIIANRQRIEKEGRGRTGSDISQPEKEKADEEAKARLKLLQLQEQAITRLANAEVEEARRAFNARTISLTQLEEVTIAAENRMLAAKRAVFEEERRQIDQSRLKATEKEVRLAEVTEREAAANQTAANKIQQIEAEREKRLREAAEREITDRLKRDATTAQAEIEQAKASADTRVITFEDSARKIAEIERDQLEQRRRAADQKFLFAGANTEEQRKVLDEIKQINAEIEKNDEESKRKINAGRQKDVADELRFQQELIKIRRAAAADQAAVRQREIEDLARRAQENPALRTSLIQAQFEAADLAAIDRHQLNLEQIDRDQKKAIEDAGANAARIEEIEQASNERRLAEDARFNADRKANRDQANRDQALLDPTSNASLFGVSDESLGKLDAFGALFESSLAKASASAGNFKSIVGGALSSVSSGLQNMITAMILTGEAGPQAFKKLAAGVIASVAAQSAIKAIFELAEGFAALARSFFGDPRAGAEAAMHFKAAAIYGIIAGVAGAAGAALSGGGAGEANSGAQGAVGAQAAGLAKPPEDKKISTGDVTGKLGPDPDSRVTVFSKIAGTLDLINGNLTVHTAATEKHAAATEKLTEINSHHAAATQSLAGRINSMSPGDVVVAGAEERPDAIASGTREALNRGFLVNDLAQALQLP